MHPGEISVEDYNYVLPEERIAKYPLPERDRSKLLVYKDGCIKTNIYRNMDQFLPGNSLLVFNNTKVVEARLLFKKPTGATIEIFCLEPHSIYPDVTSAMLTKGSVLWKCMIGGASKWKHGTTLEKQIAVSEISITLKAAIVERLSDAFVIEMSWTPVDLTFAEVLHAAGKIPLPPYLHREAEQADLETYQTIYAKHDGSVAAPTAGLHFTETIFEKLAAKNIRKDFVTLHVGAGTFKPVKAEKLEQHEMHAEFIEVSISTIKLLIESLDNTIVAVGTTSLRTIESLYWIGVKIMQKPTISAGEMVVEQWEPYEGNDKTPNVQEALEAIINWMEANKACKIITKTQILIAPGYSFKIIKGLITNFHQPQSTLLLLIAALAGKEWKKIYEYALENEFRFLSYGDGCLLWNGQD